MAKSEYKGTVGAMVKVMRADSKYLGAADLEEGKPVCVLIDGVERLTDEEIGGKQATGQRFAFRMKATNGELLKKELLINRTNLAMVRALYGDDVSEWRDKPMWLHRTTCKAFGQDDVACVRVMKRKDMPRTGKQPRPATDETQSQVVGDDELTPWAKYEAMLSQCKTVEMCRQLYDASFGPSSETTWTDQERTDGPVARDVRIAAIERAAKGGA